ncbi:MAG: TRAP transporter large permease [Firmicutes bacterium]|nr:TRAP transporter large permease [Bacillota bacterium]
MTPIVVGIIGILILFVLLFLGMNVGLALLLIGFVGQAYIAGFAPTFGGLRMIPYSTFASYSLSVIPLFILMGNLAFHSGLSRDLYLAARNWLGRLRGGLAMASVAACAAFAACSGSSVATAATLGKIALPEMKRYNYDDGLATGTLAAGGTMGILIPPSVILIIYGILTEQSIGKLFLAGVIPGILEAVFYIITIYILTTLYPSWGPPGPKTTVREKFISLRDTWGFIALFLLVIGGIYMGVFSPTEAGGIGAFGTFIFCLLRRRLRWDTFKESLIDSGQTAAMIFLIMLGANFFGHFLAVTGLPAALTASLATLAVSRYVILLLVFIFYLILGCVMDSMAMILITVPIFFPLALELGFNPIWFGIFITRVTEIGMVTPPVGMNLYVIKGVAKDVPMSTLFRGVFPFVIADILHVALITALPILATFLPSMMR